MHLKSFFFPYIIDETLFRLVDDSIIFFVFKRGFGEFRKLRQFSCPNKLSITHVVFLEFGSGIESLHLTFLMDPDSKSDRYLK